MPSLFSPTGLSPSLAGFPKTIPVRSKDHVRGPEPQHARTLVWALSPFARRYSGNRVFFLLLRLLRCFSSPGSPPIRYGLAYGLPEVFSGGFPPFRNLRINGYLLLPEAYRSLSRLSSALGAQGIRPVLLFCLASSDAIALTSDGLLVFFYHCSRSASVFVSILRFTYHQRNECFYICGFQGTVYSRIFLFSLHNDVFDLTGKWR